MAAETVHQKKRVRSPAYPAFNLESCIGRADAVYKIEDKHFAPFEAIAAHWNYKTNNSSFLQYLSALKQFGLLEEQGSKESRKFRLTPRALDIVTYNEKHEKRIQAIRDAALEPKIHRELWEKYAGKLPSEDVSIRVYLIREREDGEFNKAHVDSFICQFRETLAFSGLISDDKIDGNGSRDGESEKTELKEKPSDPLAGMFDNFFPQKPIPKSMQAVQQPETKREVFTLAEGDVMVQWPAHLSASSVEDLEDHLNLILRKVKRSVPVPNPEDQPS